MIRKGKEIVYLIAVVMFTQACTTDEVAKPTADVKNKCFLVKSTSTNSSSDIISERVYTISTDGKVMVGTYTTKNNTSSNSYSETYTYDATGKITKVEGPNFYNTYAYNTSGQLTSVSYYSNNTILSRTDIQYNSFGQVLKKIYLNNYSGPLTYTGYRLYTYPDNSSKNANKETLYNASNVIQFYVEYEYDTKFNSLASIGIDQSITVPRVNNVTKSTYTQIAGDYSVNISTSTYTYNDKGYPTQEIKTAYSIVTTTNMEYDCK